MVDIKREKMVWIVWGNEDLTEGRGPGYVIRVCETEATARRIAKGKGVQGTNAHVERVMAYQIGWNWYAPNEIVRPTKEDKAKQEKMDTFGKAIKAARERGLTDEEIKVLTSGKS